MSTKRIQTWLAVFVIVVGLLVTAAFGMFMYMMVTGPLHASFAGKQTRWAGYEGKVMSGTAVSVITLPDRGIAVAVISNMPYADLLSLAMRIAQAFAR